jgi:hypothetical protein
MISRRLFAALPLAAPLVRASMRRLDIEDMRHEPLDVGRITILSLSPDGKVLASIKYPNRLCFLDATTLEPLATGEQLDELKAIDRDSVHWSPDSKRIAFSLDAWRLMQESDIFVADVATATITNVTAEDRTEEAASLMATPDALIDVYPRWLNDATLLFARHDGSDGEVATCDICTLLVESGRIETVVPLQPHGYRFVTSPPILRADSSMIMTVQGDDQASEIIIVDANGEVSPLAIQGVQAPVLVSANATHAVVQDRASGGSLLVPIDDPMATMPFGDVFAYGDGYEFIGQPAVASDPETYAGIAISRSSKKYRLFTLINGKRQDRGYLGGDVRAPACQLVGNTLLVVEPRNAWLISLGG